MDVRAQILDLAQELIQQGGVDAVSFRILADKVGIKSSSVHYHFPKKDDLVFALSERYLKRFEEALTTIFLDNSTAKLRLRRLVSLFKSTKEQDRACFCAMLAGVNRRLDERSRSSTKQFFDMLREWIQNVLAQGKKAKEFRTTHRPKIMASVIMSALEGALLIDQLNDSTEHLDASATLIDSLIAK